MKNLNIKFATLALITLANSFAFAISSENLKAFEGTYTLTAPHNAYNICAKLGESISVFAIANQRLVVINGEYKSRPSLQSKDVYLSLFFEKIDGGLTEVKNEDVTSKSLSSYDPQSLTLTESSTWDEPSKKIHITSSTRLSRFASASTLVVRINSDMSEGLSMSELMAPENTYTCIYKKVEIKN